MRHLSLFSGILGIDLAGQWAGMESVAFCEREPFPRKVIAKHYPGRPIYEDVCTLTREVLEQDDIIGPSRTIDIISAGYPCQPFSHAGKRRGKEDDRHLWPEVARLLREIRPRWFVGENVAGHITLGLDDVLAELEGIGYEAQAFVIPAAAVGAAHRRDRVFIVAYANGAEWRAENRRSRRMAGEDTVQERSEATGRSCKCDPIMADSKSQRRREGRAQSAGQRGQLCSPGSGSSCEDVAHSQGERCGKARGDQSRGTQERTAGSCAGWKCGTTKPGMGGMLNELSAWMDGRGVNPLNALTEFIAKYPQPALMGQQQYDWEPPRVATGIKDRTARLKALGNAVDPLQFFPVMAAIKLIDDFLKKRGRDFESAAHFTLSR